MSLDHLLAEHKSDILKQWRNALFDSYQGETVKFLKKAKDRFANPVGANVNEGLEGLLDRIVAGSGTEDMVPFMDQIVRIRAIQNFTPSRALSFIFQLKGIVRRVLADPLEDAALTAEIEDFDRRIDQLALFAFDRYAACRERLFEIRVKDEQRRVHVLLKRARIVCEQEEADIELPDFREEDE